ncbi:putative mitochondrial protein [Vitis vinifera]|uniref:Putative mitochondrial protein n=1 Tax=Vitis vinifera TaxID=29760 RepID=A0A438CKT1_VITVI|nr:putative mitochondrial protein [Vitis vinifera]
MQEKIKALIQNQTWDLVPRPTIENIVGSKGVFKTKLKEDGTVDRYEAQLVARGFSQIPVTGNDNNIISDLINTLSSEFSLKDLRSLHYFLGLEVKYLPNGLLVSQTKYTRDLLEHTKMLECTHINTPMALKSIITPSDEQPIDLTQYRQLVGFLQYLTFIRLDIVHEVNKACQHFQAPTKADLRAVKHILRY